MSTRRIRALEALAERGATEGEREAARIALGKHRGAQRSDRWEEAMAGIPKPTVYKYESGGVCYIAFIWR